MVYKLDPSYLWLKGRTYYYNRHFPRDVQSHYSCRRLVICLKTHKHDLAVRSARGISQRLEEYWLSLRMARMDIPALHQADLIDHKIIKPFGFLINSVLNCKMYAVCVIMT